MTLLARWSFVAVLVLAGCRDEASVAAPTVARGPQGLAPSSSAPRAAGSASAAPPPPVPVDEGLVEFTTAGADPAQPLPLVIALHGLGDRPENFATWLRELPVPARVYALRAPTPWGPGFTWFPVTSRPGGTVDPAKIGPGVDEARSRLLADLDRLVARRPTHGWPVLTGFSQGGMLSFAMAARSPERFAGVFPISGVLPESIEPLAPPAGAPRLVAFHGDDDPRVPVSLARTSIERFTAHGWKASLRSYPGVSHAIGTDERRALLEAIGGALTGR